MKNLKNILFLPHGAPTFALDPGAAGFAMSKIAKEFDTPRAIVVISPHWETSETFVGNAPQLETIYDFFGFDEKLYQIKYPATGCPELANEIVKIMDEQGIGCNLDPHRGLDHGAWIPLRQLFPEANIPITPISLQTRNGPQGAYKLGLLLSRLAKENILILASGNITHNLGDYRVARMQGGKTPTYVQEFSDWLNEKILQGDIDSLLNYRSLSKEGLRAHPTEEHLLPLFTALGAAGPDSKPHAFYRGISDYVLAMDAYAFAN